MFVQFVPTYRNNCKASLPAFFVNIFLHGAGLQRPDNDLVVIEAALYNVFIRLRRKQLSEMCCDKLFSPQKVAGTGTKKNLIFVV
jgi:hypothetical protein